MAAELILITGTAEITLGALAELEIRHLHDKMDYLLMNQWQRLLEIQEIQTELMGEIAQKKTRGQSD
jgi:uncharacterized membrane protein